MSAPTVVDIEFLVYRAVNYDRRPSHRRVAYFAGLVCGFAIAKAFSEARVTHTDPKFWILLEGTSKPFPSTFDFVASLKSLTTPRLKFEMEWLMESGLRLGRPGIYYAQGIKDATTVGILQVPEYFKYLKGDDWQDLTIKWIKTKTDWAKRLLKFEKNRMRMSLIENSL